MCMAGILREMEIKYHLFRFRGIKALVTLESIVQQRNEEWKSHCGALKSETGERNMRVCGRREKRLSVQWDQRWKTPSVQCGHEYVVRRGGTLGDTGIVSCDRKRGWAECPVEL